MRRLAVALAIGAVLWGCASTHKVNAWAWPDCKVDPKFGDITPDSVKGVCLYGDEELE